MRGKGASWSWREERRHAISAPETSDFGAPKIEGFGHEKHGTYKREFVRGFWRTELSPEVPQTERESAIVGPSFAIGSSFRRRRLGGLAARASSFILDRAEGAKDTLERVCV